MKYSLSTIAMATLLASISATGFAGSSDHLPNAMTGPYAAVQLGYGNYNNFFFGSTTTSGFAGQIGAGYLFAIPQDKNLVLGAELSGTHYSNISTPQGTGYFGSPVAITQTNSSINVLGVAKYFLANNFNIVGKMGPSFLQTNTTTTGLPSTSSTTTGVLVGGGLGYNLTSALSLTADFEYGFFTNNGASLNPYALLVGVSYNFADMVKK